MAGGDLTQLMQTNGTCVISSPHKDNMLIDDIMVAGVIRASNLFFLAVEATSFGGIPLGSSGNREVRSILPPARQQEKSSLGTIHDRRAGDPSSPAAPWALLGDSVYPIRSLVRGFLRRNSEKTVTRRYSLISKYFRGVES